MDGDELQRMCNLAAEIFRIEMSPTLQASIPPFLSFLKWTTKAEAAQDSLKRAVKAWYSRAQKPAKIIGKDDAVDEMSPEEIEPMLSERIEKWSNELRAEGRTEGRTEGKAEGKAEGRAEGKAELFLSLFEMKFGAPSVDIRELITSAGEEEIQRLSARLLTAETADEVLNPESKSRSRS